MAFKLSLYLGHPSSQRLPLPNLLLSTLAGHFEKEKHKDSKNSIVGKYGVDLVSPLPYTYEKKNPSFFRNQERRFVARKSLHT